jgi:hypothetical protein
MAETFAERIARETAEKLKKDNQKNAKMIADSASRDAANIANTLREVEQERLARAEQEKIEQERLEHERQLEQFNSTLKTIFKDIVDPSPLYYRPIHEHSDLYDDKGRELGNETLAKNLLLFLEYARVIGLNMDELKDYLFERFINRMKNENYKSIAKNQIDIIDYIITNKKEPVVVIKDNKLYDIFEFFIKYNWSVYVIVSLLVFGLFKIDAINMAGSLAFFSLVYYKVGPNLAKMYNERIYREEYNNQLNEIKQFELNDPVFKYVEDRVKVATKFFNAYDRSDFEDVAYALDEGKKKYFAFEDLISS